MKKLKFQKMWEGANMFVYDIDTGTIIPILKTLPKIASHADKHFLFYFDGTIGGAYYENSEMKKAKESGFNDFLGEAYQKKYFEGVDNILAKSNEYFIEIKNKELKKIESDELKKILTKGVTLTFEIFGHYAACQPQRISKIEDYVKKEISDCTREGKVENIFATLSTPEKMTIMRKEEIDFLEIVLKAKKAGENVDNQYLKEEMKKHQDKYWLLGAADGEKPYNLEYFIKKLEVNFFFDTETIKTKIKELSNFAEKIKKTKRKIISKYQISKRVTDFCNLLAELGHARLEMRASGFIPLYYYNERVLEEMAKRKGYSPDIVRFLSWNEITAMMENKFISKSLLEDRKKSFLIVLNEGKTDIYSGEKAKEKLKEFIDDEDYSSFKEVKGSVAMKGSFKGTAVVFKWGEDMGEKIKRMGKDSVLIVGQTRPQLMPLISQSKAIVTDEGGITSHAAIVSRELRIPCIIGTKIATNVFKDGDYVEVDAYSGVAKLIKRTS